MTALGVAAVVVEVEATESVSCKTPAAEVEPAETERLAADEVPALVSGALTVITPDEPVAPVAPVAPVDHVAPVAPCGP